MNLFRIAILLPGMLFGTTLLGQEKSVEERLEVLEKERTVYITKSQFVRLMNALTKIESKINDMESDIKYLNKHTEAYEPDDEEWARDLRSLRKELEDFPIIKELRDELKEDDKPKKKKPKKKESSFNIQRDQPGGA